MMSVDDRPDPFEELSSSLDALPCVLATDVHHGSATGDWLEICVGEPYVPPPVLFEIARAGMALTEAMPQEDVACIANVREVPA